MESNEREVNVKEYHKEWYLEGIMTAEEVEASALQDKMHTL